MEEKSNKLYAQVPPVRLFFHAAIPGVLSMVSMSIYNIIEGIFKSFARTMKTAVSVDPSLGGEIPSSKGVL